MVSNLDAVESPENDWVAVREAFRRYARLVGVVVESTAGSVLLLEIRNRTRNRRGMTLPIPNR